MVDWMRACGGCCHDSYVNTSTAALLQSLLLHSYSTLWCTLGIYWNEEERKRGRRRMSWEKEETRLLSPLTHSGKHGESSLDFPSSFRLANFPYCYCARLLQAERWNVIINILSLLRSSFYLNWMYRAKSEMRNAK